MSGGKFVRVNPDGTGKKIAVTEVTDGAEVVERQEVVVAGAAAGEVAAVKNSAPTGTEHGLVVRTIPSATPQPVSVQDPAPFPVQYAEDLAVVGSVETTILSYTPPANVYVDGVSASGSAAYKFRIKVNGVTKWTGRSTAATGMAELALGRGAMAVAAGVSVTVTAHHELPAPQTAEVTLFGHLA